MFTVRNVLATVALFASLSGTSYAVVTIKATRIKKESLTGKDIKNKSLGQLSFSSSTFAYFDTNRKGPTGDKGPTGTQGQQGLKGSKGPTGATAPRAFSYIKADDSYQMIKGPTNPGINPPAGQTACNAINLTNNPEDVGYCDTAPYNTIYYPLWNFDCVSGGANTENYCNSTNVIPASSKKLTNSWYPVMQFVSGQTNGGYLTLDRPGNIVVTATLTLWRDRVDNHSRVACQPQVRLAASPAQNSFLLGTPTTLSSGVGDELLVMTVTGGVHLTTTGEYDFQVLCKQLDDDDSGSDFRDWYFVKGNVNAISTEQ